MKLDTYLAEKGIARMAFAEQIGVSQSLVTQLCQGKIWPGRDVARRIAEATEGAVTANDFVSTPSSEAAA